MVKPSKVTPPKVEPLACPVAHRKDFTPCDPKELEPLVAFLRTGAPVSERTDFPRGTLLPDGRLDLCKQDLGPEGAERVLEALVHHPQVSSLLLGTNGIGNTGARAVAGLIERNERVSTVYLGCNLIDATGARRIAGAARDSRVVEGLWLKRNPLGPEAGAVVAELLQGAERLRTLDLVHTGIDTEGLRELVEAVLERGRGLETLFLGGNRIDASGAAWVAELLRRHSGLRGLYLSANPLGDEGVRLLARGLAENQGLRVLGLGSTGMGAQGLVSLVDALRAHPSLESLSLGRVPSERVLGAPANELGMSALEPLRSLLQESPALRRLELRRAGLSPDMARVLVEAARGRSVRLDFEFEGRLPEDLREALQRHHRDLSADGSRTHPEIRSVYR